MLPPCCFEWLTALVTIERCLCWRPARFQLGIHCLHARGGIADEEHGLFEMISED